VIDPKSKPVPEKERAIQAKFVTGTGSGPEAGGALPPFLNAQVRQREAYLTLIKDLTEHLGEDWSSKPEADAKKRINSAIARSLEMWI
jgi:hypothetical protein